MHGTRIGGSTSEFQFYSYELVSDCWQSKAKQMRREMYLNENRKKWKHYSRVYLLSITFAGYADCGGVATVCVWKMPDSDRTHGKLSRENLATKKKANPIFAEHFKSISAPLWSLLAFVDVSNHEENVFKIQSNTNFRLINFQHARTYT